MPEIEVLPPELTAAAAPLRRAAAALHQVADHRRGLVHLVEASPSPRLVEAFQAFLGRWELVVWSAAVDAGHLGTDVAGAAAAYVAHESALVRSARGAAR